MNYYTLQVKYGNSLNPSTIEFKDLCPGTTDEKLIRDWQRKMRENLWTTGFQIETAAGTFQFISPFLIHTAYLILQDGKYGID